MQNINVEHNHELIKTKVQQKVVKTNAKHEIQNKEVGWKTHAWMSHEEQWKTYGDDHMKIYQSKASCNHVKNTRKILDTRSAKQT